MIKKAEREINQKTNRRIKINREKDHLQVHLQAHYQNQDKHFNLKT